MHLGHARTFWIAQERAANAAGALILRNDDLDGPRCRPEFVSAMLEDLRWFGLRWSEGPDIGGPLTQWHAHDDLCLSATHQVVGKTDAAGTCATGVHNTSTYFMLHVWVAPSLATSHQFQPDLTRAELAPIIRTGQS